ncbi:MAG: GntR family transcriptional regulator [Asticcacaulis sp.]|uniref:GntR family transcriptional regulator n=1 Tax=Asticcacaulis sp. TaxID=1872648 RepID=UPI0039E440EA
MAGSDDNFGLRPEADKEVRAYQSVGNSLLDRIRTGEFRVSGKLPTERELAEVYGVGRAVIRDALVMLEVKGLVQSRQGSGIYITRKAYEIDPAEKAEVRAKPAWEALPSGGPFELILAQQWLESHIARLAATQISDDDLALIQQAYDDYCRAGFVDARESLILHLHLAIAKATQNTELTVIVGQLWMRRDSDPFWKVANVRLHETQNRDRWVRDYAQVIAAIRNRDGDAAYVAMWQHLENVKQSLSEGFAAMEKPAEKASGRGVSRRKLRTEA